MKNLFAFSLILSVIFISCKKDEPASLQSRLDGGESMSSLINEYPLDSFYAKSYEGGYIFNISSAGTGMVVSKEDINQTAYFGCSNTSVSTSADIGSGQANTAAIVAACNEVYSAARICDTIVVDGYSDWYLPSELELEQVYKKVHQKGEGGFADSYYWTSTQADASTAQHVLFTDGAISFSTKSNAHYVRAVRNF